MEKSYVEFLRDKIPTDKIMLVSCCACIANEKGEILLQKRSDNKLWGLPGGLKELNETLEMCVIREVKEETNLDVEIIDFIGVYINKNMSWFGKDVAEVIGFGFEAKVVSGELKINDSESLEFGFFNKENLPKIHSNDNYEVIMDFFDRKIGGIEGKFNHKKD